MTRDPLLDYLEMRLRHQILESKITDVAMIFWKHVLRPDGHRPRRSRSLKVSRPDRAWARILAKSTAPKP